MSYQPDPSDLTTVANVVAWLDLPGDNDPNVTQRLITAQSAVIANYLNRPLASKEYTEIRSGLGVGEGRYQMVFANKPVTAVTSLMIDDVLIPPSADNGVLDAGYGFDSGKIWLANVGSSFDASYSNQFYFTKGRNNVKLVYTAGFATIPMDIEQACIELVSLRLKERTRIGMNSQTLAGQTTTFNIQAMTNSILSTLKQYKSYVAV